jgi:hypothetical protein
MKLTVESSRPCLENAPGIPDPRAAVAAANRSGGLINGVNPRDIAATALLRVCNNQRHRGTRKSTQPGSGRLEVVARHTGTSTEIPEGNELPVGTLGVNELPKLNEDDIGLMGIKSKGHEPAGAPVAYLPFTEGELSATTQTLAIPAGGVYVLAHRLGGEGRPLVEALYPAPISVAQ